MTFDEILDQAIEMLQRRKRVSYRALKLQFKLDDEYLEVLKDELERWPRDSTSWAGTGGRPTAPSLR